MAAQGAALAADLSVKAAPVPAGSYDWTGLYYGGHAGGAWGDFTFNAPTTFQNFNAGVGASALTSGTGTLSATRSSFLGGIQAGWNYQIGRFVVGEEAEYSWTSLKPTVTGSFPTSAFFPGVPVSGSETISSSMTGLGTVTTRLGLARDNLLFYSKIGGAWTGANYSLAGIDTIGATVSTASGTSRDTRFGWTLGTGFEWAFAPQLDHESGIPTTSISGHGQRTLRSTALPT